MLARHLVGRPSVGVVSIKESCVGAGEAFMLSGVWCERFAEFYLQSSRRGVNALSGNRKARPESSTRRLQHLPGYVALIL